MKRWIKWRTDLKRMSVPEWFSFGWGGAGGTGGAGAAGGALGEAVVGHGAAETASPKHSTGSSPFVPASATKINKTSPDRPSLNLGMHRYNCSACLSQTAVL